MSHPDIDISVIAPLYNEEGSVALLYERIVDAITPLGRSYEIIFVDDGSKDKTVDIASQIAKNDSHLRVIVFRRNYGQTPAMAAGIDHARGRYLITMDGDLQNDPDDIPLFLDKLDQGYDIVVGWRHKRQDKLITRKIPSRIANWLIGKITGVPIKDNGCSLKGYKAHVIKHIPLYSEMHRFIPAMTSLAGTRIAEIKVRHHARQFGESKYGLSRTYKVLLDLISIKTILSFFSNPLLFFGAHAAVFAIIGAIIITLGGQLPEHVNPTIIYSTGFINITLAAILLMWGVLGDLVYRTGNLKTEHFASLTQTQPELTTEKTSDTSN